MQICDGLKLIYNCTDLRGGGQPKDEAEAADSEGDGALPGLEAGGLDGDEALDEGVEGGEALCDAEHDEGEVEEDAPEGGDVARPEQREVGGHQLRGQTVHLVPGLLTRITRIT